MKNILPRISIIFLAVLSCCYSEAVTRKLKATTRCASTVAKATKPASTQARFSGREPFHSRYAPYTETFVSMSETSATVRLKDGLPVMHKRALGVSDDLRNLVYRESMIYRILNPKNDVRFLAKQFGIVHFSDQTSALEIERIEGANLHEVLHKSIYAQNVSYLDRIEIVLNTLRGMAQVLELFHQLGALHLDPKPENFIQTLDGRVVVIDLTTVVILKNEELSKQVPYSTNPAPEFTNTALSPVSNKTDYYLLMKRMDELFKLYLDPKDLNNATEKATLYDWVYAKLVSSFIQNNPINRPESLLKEIEEVYSLVVKFRGSEIYK